MKIQNAAHSSKVPFADLHAQYLDIKDEIDSAISQVILQSAFIRGPFVDKFEKDFSATIGVSHCVSCANGTDALYIAMHAMGVKPGDEVITTAHSWIATSETISQVGGKVVFCDTDSETFTIDPVQIEAKITSRTVGIIPVHLYGQSADMDAITAIAKKHGLWIIEDCAQAHLARFKGRMVGTFGVASAFSFYPGKNLGAMGDAGCVLTPDAKLAERMAMFARHGGLTKGDHRIEGINSRLDGLQAAILSVKLKHLKKWTERRQQIASEYDRALVGIGDIQVPKVATGREHVYHLYAIRTTRRDALKQHLHAQGIETAINYPCALPFLPAYSHLGAVSSDYPRAHAHQQTLLSLPIFPEMTTTQQSRVIEAISTFYGR